MAIHIQRKKFDAEILAKEAAEAFADPRFKVNLVEVSATYKLENGQWWVYVTQEGDLVTGDEPPLPDYERVT